MPNLTRSYNIERSDLRYHLLIIWDSSMIDSARLNIISQVNYNLALENYIFWDSFKFHPTRPYETRVYHGDFDIHTLPLKIGSKIGPPKASFFISWMHATVAVHLSCLCRVGHSVISYSVCPKWLSLVRGRIYGLDNTRSSPKISETCRKHTHS